MKNTKVRKSLSILLSLIMFLSTLSMLTVSSFALTSGDWEYSVSNNEATITKYKGTASKVTIPSKLGVYSVTSIGDDAFNRCTSLTSVTIPNSVTSIGEYAFYGCTSLTSITIGNSVTSIGLYAFYGCTSLASITIPNGVTSIGWGAFSDCTSLKNISIPNSVKSIEGWTFSDCTSLTSITIGNSVTSIPQQAFSGCTSLTSVTIPDSVTSIGWQAFFGCTSLESITIPDSVTSIGDDAFYGCTSIKSITIPDSVTSIGDSVFCNCTSLTSITIPDSVTSIGDDAFNRCTSLTSVTIPNGVKKIGFLAFFECTSLTSIVIPESVKSIEKYAYGYWGDNISSFSKIKGTSIVGVKGSEAERYAKANNIPFYEIGTFPDVKQGSWYYDSVYYVSSKGYMGGYSNGKFGPADNLKRQDFVMILARIAGADLDAYANKTSKFSDVKKGAYYYSAVNWAVENGIIGGYSNGKFGVGDNITREQVCTILYRYTGSPTVKNVDSTLKKYSDVKSISAYAKTPIAWAVQNGVISGMADGRVAPVEGASRAQIATIVMRMDQQGMFDKN